MNSREQGYEDDRFENVVSQNFHCPICFNVFKDPIMCQRNQHTYCRPCITRHLENSQRCPSCQEELTLETLNEAPRIVMDCLSELKIRCDYFSRGCRDFLQLGDLERHVKDCGFTPVLCSNEGCVVEMNKRDRIHHETEVCEFRKVKWHDCSEIRKEVDAVKVNLDEANEKLEEMNINFKIVSDKVGKMEENQRKFDKLATDIQKMKEEIKKEVRDTERDTNNIKPSVVVAGGRYHHSNRLRSVEMFDWATRTWSPLQPMNECRTVASSFVYEDQFTIAGGWTDYGLIDAMTRMNIKPVVDSTPWLDFPAKLPDKLCAYSNVVYDERLITVGGYQGGSNYSDRIDEILLVQPYTRNFLSRMAQPMYDINQKECKQMATVRWGDNVIVIGGADKDGKVLNTVVIYNVQTGKSHMLPEMKCKRQGCTAVVSQGTIVVMGGKDERNTILNSVECFTFDHYSWEDLPPMSEARYRATAVGW